MDKIEEQIIFKENNNEEGRYIQITGRKKDEKFVISSKTNSSFLTLRDNFYELLKDHNPEKVEIVLKSEKEKEETYRFLFKENALVEFALENKDNDTDYSSSWLKRIIKLLKDAIIVRLIDSSDYKKICKTDDLIEIEKKYPYEGRLLLLEIIERKRPLLESKEYEELFFELRRDLSFRSDILDSDTGKDCNLISSFFDPEREISIYTTDKDLLENLLRSLSDEKLREYTKNSLQFPIKHFLVLLETYRRVLENGGDTSRIISGGRSSFSIERLSDYAINSIKLSFNISNFIKTYEEAGKHLLLALIEKARDGTRIANALSNIYDRGSDNSLSCVIRGKKEAANNDKIPKYIFEKIKNMRLINDEINYGEYAYFIHSKYLRNYYGSSYYNRYYDTSVPFGSTPFFYNYLLSFCKEGEYQKNSKKDFKKIYCEELAKMIKNYGGRKRDKAALQDFVYQSLSDSGYLRMKLLEVKEDNENMLSFAFLEIAKALSDTNLKIKTIRELFFLGDEIYMNCYTSRENLKRDIKLTGKSEAVDFSAIQELKSIFSAIALELSI